MRKVLFFSSIKNCRQPPAERGHNECLVHWTEEEYIGVRVKVRTVVGSLRMYVVQGIGHCVCM